MLTLGLPFSPQLVIDVRTILEDQEHQQPTLSPASPAAGRNIYLVLDRHCQPIPWESLPSLRGQSITRIPSTPFLDDRVLLAGGPQAGGPLRPTLDHRNGLYILNPGGDLVRTQKTFAPWTEKMDALGWTGIVGRAPSEEELVHALQTKDVVVCVPLPLAFRSASGAVADPLLALTPAHLAVCQLLWPRRRGAVRAVAQGPPPAQVRDRHALGLLVGPPHGPGRI